MVAIRVYLIFDLIQFETFQKLKNQEKCCIFCEFKV